MKDLTFSPGNIGRTIMQCLPALSLISILNPLTYRHRLQSIIDTQSNVGLKPSDTGGPGEFGLISNRLAGLSSAFKSFSYKKRQKDEEERSVRVITVDSYVFEVSVFSRSVRKTNMCAKRMFLPSRQAIILAMGTEICHRLHRQHQHYFLLFHFRVSLNEL